MTNPKFSFSAADLEQLAARGLTADEALAQLDRFRNRPRPAPLVRACTLGDGLRALNECEELRREATTAISRGRLTKFVPASGAASRMFQSLAEAHKQADPTVSEAYRTLRDSLERFAFYEQLATLLDPIRPEDMSPHRLLEAVLGTAATSPDQPSLDQPSLGLAKRPKALIPFHRDSSGSANTAFEEHLVEAAQLASASKGDEALSCRAHFTISPEHQIEFERLLAECQSALEEAFGVQLVVDFSTQEQATDTLAGTFDSTPFRVSVDDDSELLFRPGGHGALIGNLSRLGKNGADLVTIKNIDNVKPSDAQHAANERRLELIGLASRITRTAHALLAELSEESPTSGDTLQRAIAFLVEELERSSEDFGTPPTSAAERESLRQRLVSELDRPLRVCGMVVNDGEPGGGPFWVEEDERGVACQIVESAQIDRSNPDQNSILESATHFNPVELVCSLRDWQGRPFDLDRFVDHDSWFVSEKSKDGKELLALERPGLWNGAMGRWNTVFVEVPSLMFAPVKTVLDLLRDEHQTTTDPLEEN